MLLFLGDSSTIGVELEIELSEPMPKDYNLSTVYNQGLPFPKIPPFRADLAYPQLIANALDQPFWNLGIQAASYDVILSNFQKFIKLYEVPTDTTVFLSSVSFFRRTMIDSFDNKIYRFFPYPLDNPPQICYDAEELLMRTAPRHAVQQINHIYEICKSRNWTFVFHGVGHRYSEEELDAINKICDIPQEHRLSRLYQDKNWQAEQKDLWFGCHPSVKGHEQIANELIAHYKEQIV